MKALGIEHLHQAHVGQLRHSSVIDLNGHHIVLAVGHRERRGEVFRVDEVAEHEGRAAALHGLGQILQGNGK